VDLPTRDVMQGIVPGVVGVMAVVSHENPNGSV
jgi:hypothetical protein